MGNCLKKTRKKTDASRHQADFNETTYTLLEGFQHTIEDGHDHPPDEVDDGENATECRDNLSSQTDKHGEVISALVYENDAECHANKSKQTERQRVVINALVDEKSTEGRDNTSSQTDKHGKVISALVAETKADSLGSISNQTETQREVINALVDEKSTEGCDNILSQTDTQGEVINALVVEKKADGRDNISKQTETQREVINAFVVGNAGDGRDSISHQTDKQRENINALVVEKKTEIHDDVQSHQTHLENASTISAGDLLATDFKDIADREKGRLDKDLEPYKRDFDALATMKKVEIVQHHQQQNDKSFRTSSTNKLQPKIKTNSSICATAIEGAGNREIERIDEDAEAHKRDIDEVATRKKAEIIQHHHQHHNQHQQHHQQQQQADEAFKADTTNKHLVQIETNTNLLATTIEYAGDQEIQRIDEGAEAHKQDIDALADPKRMCLSSLIYLKDSTNKHKAQFETHTNVLATAIEDTGDREIERIDEVAEAHKRYIDALSTRKKAELLQQQQEDEAIRAASTSKHKAQLEERATLSVTAVDDAADLGIEHTDEGTEAHKRDIDALATRTKAEISQHQQQRQEEDEALRADSTNKHKAQLETNTNLLATAIEDAGDREIERIDKGAEAHKRDIDELASSKKAEITQPQQHQQQQEEDEAVRAGSTNIHQAQIETNTNLCLTAIEGAGDREIERIYEHQAQTETNTNLYVTAIEDAGDQEIQRIGESAKEHKRDIGELATRTKTEITQQQQQQQQQEDEAFRAELKETLLKHHLNRNSFLSLGPFISSDDSRLKEFYVPPTLSEVLQQRISEKNGSREHKTRLITSLEQLLTPADTTKQFTIITANAGVGKTSFCKFIAVLWCALHGHETDTISTFKERFDIPFESLEEIPYLLYIPLRDIPPDRTHSIEDIVFAHLENVTGYLKQTRDKLKRVFMDERCLVIIDGMDESSLSTLGPAMAKRKYSIIITCRPWKLADMELPKYMHVNIDDLSRISQQTLFEHVNKILNAQYSTTFEVQDFLENLVAKKLQPLSSNTLVGLQLYCLWHDQRMDDETSENNKTSMTLGPTRSHIYAGILEMMFSLAVKKIKELSERPQNKISTQRPLPTCFEGRKLCKAKSCLIYETGKIALKMLVNSKIDFDEETMQALKDGQFLLDSGLISANRSNKCSIENNVYYFLHKTYQEIFAAIYISSLSFKSEDWLALEVNFNTVFSPDIMSFLCVMNYEQGRRCSQIFGNMKREFNRENTFYTNEIIEYQETVQLAYDECVNNGVSEPQLTLRHARLNREISASTGPLLQQNLSGLYSCAIKCSKGYPANTSITSMKQLNTLCISSGEKGNASLQSFPTLFLNKLTVFCLFDLNIETDNLNLASCGNLKVIVLQNLRLSHVTIDPTQLENFSVSIKNHIRENIPPMEVTIAQGRQFTNKLKELYLDNVTLNETLNIQQCDKLQELHLDTLTFSDDFHLDLSSSTHLSVVVLRNLRLRHVAIAPTKLEKFWVYIKDNIRENTPPMEVTFAHGRQFTNKLKELSLDNVNLNETLNIQQCDKLQELQLDTLTFSDDFHLDLSSFTHLSKVVLQNLRLRHLTIDPTQLEMFWVYIKNNIRENIPPMEVTFAHGRQFTNTLKKLSLDYVTLNETLNIQQCDKLQKLRLVTLTFSNDFHLDLSSSTHLSYVVLQNLRLRHLTIDPTQLEKFWVYIKNNIRENIPPMEVTFAHGRQFTNTLKELRLDYVTLNETLNIQQCDKLQELQLDTLTFSDDFHLDLSSFTHLSKVVLQNLRLRHLTIDPTQLEKFWVYIKNNIRENIPPMEVTFAHGRQFTNTLKELRLDYVTLNETLNIQQCDKLQELVFDTLTFPDDFHLDLSSSTHLSKVLLQNLRLRHVAIAPTKLEKFWVCINDSIRENTPPMEVTFAHGRQFTNTLKELSLDNVNLNETLNIQQCDKQQELQLATLTFSNDFHLDLSSSTHLSNVVLQNLRLRHVAIAPTKLEKFCVYINNNIRENTPPMEVTLAQGRQFTNKLRELRLDNVTLSETLNIPQCDNLQKLVFDTLTFPDDFHLDLSSITNLREVILQRLRLKHVTIAPALLEMFWVDTGNNILENTPSMEVTFANGEQFTNKLRKLSLDNVTLNETLNIQQCDKLQHLLLDTLSFPDDYHLDLSSFTDITVLILHNHRLQHVTIATVPREEFWDSIKTYMRENTPPMEVTFSHGRQFKNQLRELRLFNVTLNDALNIQQSDKLQKLQLETLLFPDDSGLDLSPYTDLTVVTLQNLHLHHLIITPAKLGTSRVLVNNELSKLIPHIKATLRSDGQLTNISQIYHSVGFVYMS